MELTFDNAMELLEIADISRIGIDDLPQIEKKAKKRWHPDRVMHLNDTAITQEYTINFQRIEGAIALISSYLSGTYQAGEAFTESEQSNYREPEEVIRENAPELQATLSGLWNEIKAKKYKWHQKEVVLSDGYSLKDILAEDFREDIAMLSVVSFFYGSLCLGLLSGLLGMITPALGVIIGIIWMFQALSCILGFLPISRFWLPQPVQPVMFRFINFGLGVFNWAEARGLESSGPWVSLLVMIPVLFAKLVKYVVLFPIYELSKAIIGDKVVGVVKKRVDYYADAADWYIDELMAKRPAEMSSEELFHLSILCRELSDVKQYSYA